MIDLISRQAAIDEVARWEGYLDEDMIYCIQRGLKSVPSAQPEQAVKGCRNCKYGKYNDHWKTHFCYNPNECTEWNLWEPSAQPEITLESAIDYLHKIGWMQEHDRILTESAQPEIVHCKDCKWKQGAECVRFAEIRVFPNDFCSRAEKREDG